MADTGQSRAVNSEGGHAPFSQLNDAIEIARGRSNWIQGPANFVRNSLELKGEA